MFTRRIIVKGAVTTLAGAGLAMPPLRRVFAMAQVHLPQPQPWAHKLVAAAVEQVGETTIYDPGYHKIAYPMGDIARDHGVCTDVIIRAYRDAFGMDLQRLVHEDMVANFSAYPQQWDMKGPDANIDHRRVPNLQAFLTRHGARLVVGERSDDFAPGDLITQMLPGNLPHIALVTDRPNTDHSRPLMVHNIGRGAELADTLFAFTITGQFRYPPAV
jgi:hypothetical protein